MDEEKVTDALKRYFKHESFKSELQKDAVIEIAKRIVPVKLIFHLRYIGNLQVNKMYLSLCLQVLVSHYVTSYRLYCTQIGWQLCFPRYLH